MNYNPKLFGILEWISSQGGTINDFGPWLVTGTVRGLSYRYFISDGWIGFRKDGEKIGSCETLQGAKDTIIRFGSKIISS